MSGRKGLDISAFQRISQQDIAEYKKEFKSGGMEAYRKFMGKKLQEWKTVPLNVAVIGNTGVGKSSFINAVRRLTADDEGAAAVGATETTSDIAGYSHPNNHMLKFWDLPGVGTGRYPKDEYLTAIEIEKYDFFLLMSSSRFTENDTWLADEISKQNRKCFYVRTKLGHDLSGERDAHPRTYNEQSVIQGIRENVVEHLREHGADETPVFVVDSYKPQKFDFQQLEQSLNRDFQELKRSAMILSMSVGLNREMVSMKVVELRSRIWKVAAASEIVAGAQLRGLSVVFDLAAVLYESNFYFKQLNLDDNSLRDHARWTGTDFDQLKAIVTNALTVDFPTSESITAIAQTVQVNLGIDVNFIIPVIGSLLATSKTFSGTYIMLNTVLNLLEKVTLEVMNYALEHARALDNE